MTFFLTIVGSMFIADILWWIWSHLRLSPLKHRRLCQSLLAIFMLGQIIGLAWFLLFRTGKVETNVPSIAAAGVYLWHLIVLPVTSAGLALGLLIVVPLKLIHRFRAAQAPDLPEAADTTPESTEAPARPLPSRRQILAAAAIAVPPLFAAGAAGVGVFQLNHFRIRKFTVAIPTLPAALEGLTIAHVTDLHIGRFTGPDILPAIVDQTNKLNPDLVCMTGDLIDFSLNDLPAAIDVIKGFRPRHGVFVCEGNHDLFENRSRFEGRMLAAGVPLLLNGEANLKINNYPVQMLGIRWGSAFDRRDLNLNENMRLALTLRRAEAFPILLAHHPDAFDPAAAAGIPLTLAGHTHGGQLMLTDKIGAGPIMFKYWSGLYRKPSGEALVVSNGTGNWFPLRVNAPAEILHITLRQGA